MYTDVHTQKHTYTHKSLLKIEKSTINVRYEIRKMMKTNTKYSVTADV